MIFNNAVLPKTHFDKRFDQAGIVHLTCNVHKEMNAWLLVMQNRYFVKPDKSGAFALAGVPPGVYTVRIWGEALSDEQNAKKYPVTVGAASTPLKVASN